MIGKTFIIKKNKTKVKVLKQYGNTVLVLNLDNPKKIFWHREVDRKYVIKVSDLEKVNEPKQTQNSLF
jgi:adenylate kinase